MAAAHSSFPILLPSPARRVGVALPVALSIGVHGALAALALWMQPAPAAAPPEEELIEISWLGGGMGGGPGDGEEGPGDDAPAPEPVAAQPAPPAPAPRPAAVPPPTPAPAPEPEPVAPVEEPTLLAAAETADAEDVVAVQDPAPTETEEVEAPAEPVPVEPPSPDRVDALPKDRTLASLGAPPSLGRRGGGGGDGSGPGRGRGHGSGMGDGLGDGVVDVRHAVTPPKLQRHEAPEYPRVAKRRGIEGTVVLRLVLGRDGRVETDRTQVLRSIPELDEAAIRAVRNWRFSPARDADGKAIRVALQLPVRFTLQ